MNVAKPVIEETSSINFLTKTSRVARRDSRSCRKAGMIVPLATSTIALLQLKRFQELTESYGITATELSMIKSKFHHINSEDDFQKFVEQEELEMKSTDPNKQNLSACIAMADNVFYNSGTIEELNKKVEAVLDELRK